MTKGYLRDLQFFYVSLSEHENLLSVLCFTVLQAYTSQFVSLVMFGLMMCEDRISMQGRRREIIQGLRKLPGNSVTDAGGRGSDQNIDNYENDGDILMRV